MRILLLGGKTGLLGQALKKACDRRNWSTLCLGRHDDLFNAPALHRLITDERITAIINTVAYTQVDKAEKQPEEAARLNADLPEILGKVAVSCAVPLVHYSTDFVFDGAKGSPYLPTDSPNPQSVYGQTKLEGEQRLLALGPQHVLILRTAWLFGPDKTNFVHKILGLARKHDRLTIVHDQIGSPSCTTDVSEYCAALIEKQARGRYHVVNAGQASWYELTAQAVKLAGISCRVEPIASADFPQQAKRPPYSVLDHTDFEQTAGITPRPWQEALAEYIRQSRPNLP